MPDDKGLYSLISWLIVIAGWIIVNQQNNRREERKELRAALSEIYKLIDGIVELAVDYHCKEDHSTEKSREIRLQLQRLGLKIIHLHFYSDDVNMSTYEFRSAITLENFDTKSFKKQSKNSEIIESIYANCDALIDNLEACFCRSFRQGIKTAIAAEFRRLNGMIKA